jgi:hypothetical protein
MADFYFPHIHYADRPPLATDDSSKGFIVGQLWVDQSIQTGRKLYFCYNNTDSHAEWRKTSGSWEDIENKPDPTLTVVGGATGTCTFTDLGNATLNLTIDPDAHVHDNADITSVDWTKILNKPDPILTLTGDATGTCTFTDLQSSNLNVLVDATPDNIANKIVRRDADGNFSANEINAISAKARYADLAERYTCKQKDLPIGTVVLVSEDDRFDCEMSNEICSTRVLGVVSEAPAYLMNNDIDGPAIARVGKVKCLVDGPVKKGTMLVSGMDGIAMPVDIVNIKTCFCGKVVGKANQTITTESIELIEIIM